jgi:hypothetical protein
MMASVKNPLGDDALMTAMMLCDDAVSLLMMIMVIAVVIAMVMR